EAHPFFMQLDETDLMILKVLQDNGRLSYRQIADKVKVSVPTISNKIANLEKARVIRGYSAILDPDRLGETSVMITVKARPSDLKGVGETLAKDEHVRGAFLLSNCRLLLSCTFPETHQVNDFINRLGQVTEIIDYDVGSVIGAIRDDPRAIVSSGLSTVLECAYCKVPFRGPGVKLKLDGKEYHVCCPVCAKGLQDKYDKIKEKA
ncbi:MAG TPA: winged helix-turn-helix transcriptional regulator, partial [Methanomassiliicoccales archaeon]|nr:winged helix-turn-helix transcriptional regulator [Methanomassiliicoccales archaeon]